MTKLQPHLSRAGFQPLSTLTENFLHNPDPLLVQMGGCRIDIAIGVGRNAYQLELTHDIVSGAVTVSWVMAQTSARKLKDTGATVALDEQVPVTLEAAVVSLCEAFSLNPDDVWSQGVDLLSFWEAEQANERLELPMSRDWHRHSLKKTPLASPQF